MPQVIVYTDMSNEQNIIKTPIFIKGIFNVKYLTCNEYDKITSTSHRCLTKTITGVVTKTQHAYFMY